MRPALVSECPSPLIADLIQDVHLKGAFMVTRAAFPYMKKQQYGR